MRVLLRISYLGTNYHGWQVQPNGITVQEELQNALQSVYKTRPDVTGCSRTDAGVHAKEFYCHYDVDTPIPESGVIAALNSVLPKDIAVTGCRYVADDFHARYCAKGKNYIYKIYNSRTPDPFTADRSWQIARALDIESMNKFASGLIGTHDFVAFSSSGRTVESTVRTISECEVTRDGDIITVSVSADGFLYNMVRIIVGTLVDVSDGRIAADSAAEVLISRNRNAAGFTAPAHGLYLNKVFY